MSVQCLSPDCTTNKGRNTVGKCPKCGKDLKVIYSKAGKRFIGCSGYPTCDRTYPLPQMGVLSGTEEICEVCQAPMLFIKSKGRSWKFCANIECGSKNRSKDVKGKVAAKAKKKTPQEKHLLKGCDRSEEKGLDEKGPVDLIAQS